MSTSYTDITTLTNGANTEIKTARLENSDVQELLDRDPTQIPTHPKFWCISLEVVDLGVEMVINISDTVMLGRLGTNSQYPFIDLSGYNAHEYGVSREHTLLLLKDDNVMIKDYNSSNHTLVNNMKLLPMEDYPLKQGDTITLGKLKLKFNLLFDPLAY